MDDELDTMLVEVRASTQGFEADIRRLRGTLDADLVSGLDRAGQALEAGLLRAVRQGGLGFEELKRIATGTLDQIAAHALQMGLDRIFGGSDGLAGIIGGSVGALLGLPGRATGGPVAPGRGYLVGERGPEVFVPTSAGRVEPDAGQRASRAVTVAINLAPERGTNAPRALQRSSRQIASAIRRALEK
ncbi:tail tape measure protein [Qipengyuania sp. JC766]|uniref:tail tape measure protein n=1 Tax=Qipengyuania sp. JC766 TaxID=3232139 RepID=UPI0034581398